MSYAVWKFPLDGNISDLEIPSPGIIRLVGDQNGFVTLWVEVWPESPDVEKRRFVICGTGQEIPVGGTHRGSVIVGGYVWHVYEAILVSEKDIPDMVPDMAGAMKCTESLLQEEDEILAS